MGWLNKKLRAHTEKPVGTHTEKSIQIDAQELEDLRNKAKAYDKLVSGQTGAFLRRNKIID